MVRQTVERCWWTGDLERVIVRTLDAGTSVRTQFRHFTDKTIKGYVDDLETSIQTHVHLSCGLGSVFLWRQCYTLCTSGFADNALFPHNGNDGPESSIHDVICFVKFARWRYRRRSCYLRILRLYRLFGTLSNRVSKPSGGVLRIFV